MPYFNFKNMEVFYKIKGKGKPILLLHGNTMSSKMFATTLSKYTKNYKTILIDFPGHGKSQRLEKFETDFWFYNSEVCYALLKKLDLSDVAVIGTSGGALVGINLCLEHPKRIKCLIADSFEGEYPLESYVKDIESDREKDKKKLLAKLIWWYMHGRKWRNVVDADTKVNIDFYASGRSFFHKDISELKVPTYLTGSKKDEYCDYLEEIYKNLNGKNLSLQTHIFDSGRHPAMISNKNEFFDLVNSII